MPNASIHQGTRVLTYNVIGQEVFCVVAPRNNQSGLITQFWIVLVIFNDICSIELFNPNWDQWLLSKPNKSDMLGIELLGFAAHRFPQPSASATRWRSPQPPRFLDWDARIYVIAFIYGWQWLSWFDWVVGFITPNKHQMSLMCSRHM